MAKAAKTAIDWAALRARLGRGAAEASRRGYALALIAVILWTSYQAISYLVVTLLSPPDAPGQVRDVPRRLDESILHGRRPDWLGLAAVENPRAPLAHYHRFDNWLPSDRFNDCTRSGCHAPLPHAEHKEVRAFLNMHATIMHCGVCHMTSPQEVPLPLGWYDLQTGRNTQAPPLLHVHQELRKLQQAPQPSPDDVRLIAEKLRLAAAAADADPGLWQAAGHLEAVHPGSRRFPEALQAAAEIVRRSFRGSYGAKLALWAAPGDAADLTGRPILGHGAEAAAQRLLALPADAGESQRAAAVTEAHPLKREAPRQCADCHGDGARAIDFAGLAYPPDRQKALTDPIVVRMIENIAAGKPFHMPGASAP